MIAEATAIPDAVGQFWDMMRDRTACLESYSDPVRFAEECVWIRDKKETLIKYHMKEIQRIYREKKAEAVAAGRKPWYIVVKSRQVGITTQEMVESFHAMITGRLKHQISIADTGENSGDIFQMLNRMYDHMPSEVQPYRTDSRTQLVFPELDNKMTFHTGSGRSPGRGKTLSKVHVSEAARIKITVEQYQDFISGIQSACENSEIVLESTTQGASGWFYEEVQKCLRGESEYTLIFLPWFADPENAIPLYPGESIERTTEEKARSERLGPWTDEQIKYRRARQSEHGRLFPQEYPETIEEAFLVQEGCWFDVEAIKDLIPQCRPVEAEHDNGNLSIWHQPIEGAKYYMGADTAEGLAKGDASICGVLDADGRQCAALHGRWPADVFGKKLAALGRYYENAFIGVEANNHGHSVLNTLQNTEGYRNLYIHQDYDADARSKGKVGFQTTGKSRPLLLDAIRDEAIEGRGMEVNDRMFLSECMNFCLNDKGTKYEARPGSHDDRVMAWAIAWWVRKTAPREARAWVL